VEAPPAEKSSISVTALSPLEGGELNKSMIIGVDVEYHIADFKPGDYFLGPIFATRGFGGMAPGKFEQYPSLTAASGKAHFCIPLDEVYEHSTVRWPLSMQVNLMRRLDGVSTTSMATSRPYSFRVTDIPSGALERQANDPTQEYQFALMKAWGYYRFRSIAYKLCIEKYPAMQPVYTKAYRDWESRHRADIDFINQVQFESYLKQVRGHTEIAMRIEDQATGKMREAVEKTQPEELKVECDLNYGDASGSKDTTHEAIGKALEVVRKNAPKLEQGAGK